MDKYVSVRSRQKAREVLGELEELLDSGRWEDTLTHARATLPAGPATDTVMLHLPSAIKQCVVRLLADYHRRVIARLDTLPYQLLWFGAVVSNVDTHAYIYIYVYIYMYNLTSCIDISVYHLVILHRYHIYNVYIYIYMYWQWYSYIES